MLIVSEERYVPTAVNMMVLQGPDDLYYYLHRSLYDQCAILYDLYGQQVDALYRLLGWETEIPEVCSDFYQSTPAPVSILAPFLTLVGGCDDLDNIEDMCGALSSMSMSIDFRKMLKVPMQIRQSVKFSLHVREEYRVQWDRFFTETPTYEDVLEAQTAYRHPAADYEDDYEDDNPYANATFVGEDVVLPSPEEFAAMGAAVSAESIIADSAPAAVADSSAPSGFDLLKGLK